jgi:hypothetical protein
MYPLAKMNTTLNVTKTVTRVFSESQIPEHLRTEVLRIKAEAAKTVAKPREPVKSPLTKEVVVSPRPGFLEPISPIVKSTPDAARQMMLKYQKQNMEEFYQWEANQPSTWLRQIEVLENRRSVITKKGKLSAEDAYELDLLDEKIEYCEDVLAELENDYFEDSE